MSTSASRIAANRRNAKKSTGPRTAEGKARVSQNALTHGLTAQSLVLAEESWPAWHALRRRMFEDLTPQGETECQLVEHMVAAQWRITRAWEIETGLYNHSLAAMPDPAPMSDPDAPAPAAPPPSSAAPRPIPSSPPTSTASAATRPASSVITTAPSAASSISRSSAPPAAPSRPLPPKNPSATTSSSPPTSTSASTAAKNLPRKTNPTAPG